MNTFEWVRTRMNVYNTYSCTLCAHLTESVVMLYQAWVCTESHWVTFCLTSIKPNDVFKRHSDELWQVICVQKWRLLWFDKLLQLAKFNEFEVV